MGISTAAARVGEWIRIGYLPPGSVVGMRHPWFVLLGLGPAVLAQGPGDFPELVPTAIRGAPALGSPELVMAATAPVVARQHGLASPAMHDHDGDGLADLWIGEFETTECWVRVYGTDALGVVVRPQP